MSTVYIVMGEDLGSSCDCGLPRRTAKSVHKSRAGAERAMEKQVRNHEILSDAYVEPYEVEE